MKQTKRASRLGMALIALIATLAMTVTSTYAWFSLQGAATVDNFQLDVMSGSGMISMNLDQNASFATWSTTPFKTILTAAEFNAMLTELVKTADPLGYEISNLNSGNFRLGAFTTQTDLTANLANEAGTGFAPNTCSNIDGGWLEFYINFRAMSALDVTLAGGTLDPESAVSMIQNRTTLTGMVLISAWDDFTVADCTAMGIVKADGTAYTATDELAGVEYAGTEIVIAKGSSMYISAAYAARFAFGAIPSATNWSATVPDTFNIWDPQTTLSIYDNLIGAGPTYHRILNFTNTGDVTKNFGEQYRFGTMGTDYGAGGNLSVLNNVTLNTGANTGTKLVTLAAPTTEDGFYYGRLVVRIWLEGKDSATMNAVLRDTFKAKLVFTQFTNS